MKKRIVIFCEKSGLSGRHRWHWKIFSYDNDVPLAVWDRRCIRCGYWYTDVLG